MKVLVTGATGYVGGRLVPRLLEAGHEVRCLSRSADRLRDQPWFSQVTVAQGDVRTGAGLAEALADIDLAYYLIHSIGQANFEDLDRRGATAFSRAAATAGVARLVYLGGPDPAALRLKDAQLSPHLRSRNEVAKILLASGVPTTVFRAAVIIGSGSASFEMLRHLTERLPVMVTPRWVTNHIEPISIRDAVRYLVDSAAPGVFPLDLNRGFDIGCGEILTYGEMMRRYAVIAGLGPRMIIPLRPLTPSLSSLWVGTVTPVPSGIARPLVESLIHDAITREHDIAAFIPDPPGGLANFDTSVRLALRKIREADVETRWSDAAWPGAPTDRLPADSLPSDPSWSGATVYSDVRRMRVRAPSDRLWRVIESIGGENGWYSFPLAWAVRGWADRLAGGVGLRRGRRDPHRLAKGEALDFWRVEEIVPGQLLRLRAEMRLPGRAWLEMRVNADGDGTSTYSQRAIFMPRGLPGRAYWTAIVPFHRSVFGGMARNIAKTAESRPHDARALPPRGRQEG